MIKIIIYVTGVMNQLVNLRNFSMMEIKVLGAGCAKCKKLEKSTELAVEELGVEANIVKVEDIDDILAHGVMMTPALVINGNVVHSGRIAGKKEIIGLIKPHIK